MVKIVPDDDDDDSDEDEDKEELNWEGALAGVTWCSACNRRM